MDGDTTFEAVVSGLAAFGLAALGIATFGLAAFGAVAPGNVVLWLEESGIVFHAIGFVAFEIGATAL